MLSISPPPSADSTQPAAAEAAATKTPDGSAGAAAQTESDEHRTEPRHPASAVPAITGLRFSPHGVDAVLVNISESGLLAEVAERLKPGSAVTAVFEGTLVPNSIEGRVARTTVSAMGKDGRLRYHVGVSFSKRFRLDLPEPVAPPPAAAEPEPPPAPVATVVATPAAPIAAPAPAKPAPVKAAALQEIEIEIEIPLPDPEPPVVRNRW
jgi:PilZ domain